MNIGIIASRYAKALLKYVQEFGGGEQVYSQACVLVRIMDEVPQMTQYITDESDVTFERKVALLSAALGEDVAPALFRFLKLVSDNRRVELFPRMLFAFIEQYRIANNVMVGVVVTASKVTGIGERLEAIFHEKTGGQVQLEERVDHEIIGGFVFELDGVRLDASVEGYLARIRRILVEKNNRIV
jgi:F-type H+-transporting ATPase subunit delta